MNIVIGGTPIEVITDDAGFRQILQGQYSNFIEPASYGPQPIRLTVDLISDSGIPPDESSLDEDLAVTRHAGHWHLRRGDFRASYDPIHRSGVIRQSANRHSIDSVIRIIHSLTLVPQGGFLLHSASAIRHGRAWLFAGPSGAGKTTLSRLVPSDASLLSDEVSFVRKSPMGYFAWGTPFAGELAQPGVNCSAPVHALCFLEQAQTNRLTRLGRAEALQLLLTNILFFADDPPLVAQLFEVAGDFANSVDVFRLSFTPDARVWDLLQ